MGIIIVASSGLVTIIVVFVIACLVCSRKRKQKNELEAHVDVNPVYDGAADYLYDEMGNYDSIKVLTMRKKEVKVEVVDRSSIYGQKEEGWEGALAVDKNPYYEG